MKLRNVNLIITIVILFVHIGFGQVKYDMKNITKKYGDCDKAEMEKCVTATIDYPVFSQVGSSDISKTLNSAVIRLICTEQEGEMLTKTPEDYANKFVDDYKEYLKDTGIYITPWAVEKKVTVNFTKDNFICIKYDEYSFTGGAHPNGFLYFENYDIRTGRKINYEDIFVKDYRNKLNSVVEKYFRKVRKLKAKQNLMDGGFEFENSKFDINDNFSFTKNSLIIYYNSYEIAPYVLGPTEVLVPLKEIKHLIQKDCVINW